MFSETKECMDYIHALLTTNKTALGLGYIGYGDEQLRPAYPAVLVDSGFMDREIHATHQFQLFFNVVIWVYHAKMSVQHSVRTAEDMALATAIRNVIHADYTFGGEIVFGYVDNETPGTIRRGRSEIIVGTRLGWAGRSVVPFT